MVHTAFYSGKKQKQTKNGNDIDHDDYNALIIALIQWDQRSPKYNYIKTQRNIIIGCTFRIKHQINQTQFTLFHSSTLSLEFYTFLILLCTFHNILALYSKEEKKRLCNLSNVITFPLWSDFLFYLGDNTNNLSTKKLENYYKVFY